MPRVLSISCSGCHRKYGGHEAWKRHRVLAGDRFRCMTPGELVTRNYYFRDGAWHRGASLLPPTTASLFDGAAEPVSPAENAPGKAHRTARDTERKAAREIAPRTGTSRAKVLFSIDALPQTDDELQRRLSMNPNTQRPRRVELVEGGYIEDSGERRKTASNSDAIVWQVTASGRLWCLQEAAVSA